MLSIKFANHKEFQKSCKTRRIVRLSRIHTFCAVSNVLLTVHPLRRDKHLTLTLGYVLPHEGYNAAMKNG